MGTALKRAGLRHGSAAVTAMLYLSLMAVLALAMASMASVNVQTAYNYDGIERARANAEMGLRWLGWRFHRIALPQTQVGIVDSATAGALWPTIMTTLRTNLSDMNTGVLTTSAVVISGATLHIGPVLLPDKGTFELWATPKPPNHPDKAQVIEVKATGTYRGARRAMTMQFLIQKSMRYGVLSKIPIQLGKNTVVEGDVYMAAAPGGSTPPLLSISDFRYTSGAASPLDELTQKVAAFQKFIGGKTGGQPNYGGSDNRLPADSAAASALKASNSLLASMSDYNADGFLDEYDLFLQQFDTSGTGHRVSLSEYSAAAPKDPNLFAVIDKGIGKPVSPDDVVRAGYNDGYLDSLDPYAKVRGTVKVWETRDSLAARLGSSQTIADVMQGSFESADGSSSPVIFGCNDPSDPATQITPGSFNMSAFLSLSGANAGAAVRPGTLPPPDSSQLYADTSITKTDGNGTADATLIAKLKAGGTNPITVTKKVNGVNTSVLTDITESVPYGSTNPRSSVQRKVFSGVNFKNCIVSRGTNALFVNCTFDGVTFVDGDYNMQKSSADYAKGNNLRFEGCTFTGPVTQGDALATGSNRGAAPAAYTDYTNSWEFTGATTFDLTRGSKDGSADSEALATIKQQATIMAPQTNIEMGSFTAPGQATCSFQGVVVAGCFDVRGTADIDGTIIVPATAAGNVTLGYFGPDDNATNQGAPDPSMVSGSYGRVHVRFNPYRTLPDGINMAVSMLPDPTTWREVTP